MSDPRVILTAGFNRARHVLATTELLWRSGVSVEGLLVVSPYSWKRLKSFVQREGMRAVWEAVPRLLGLDTGTIEQGDSDPFTRLYEKYDIERQSLKSWAKARNVTFRSVTSINDEGAVEFVEATGPDWVIYGGGGILRRAFIDAADGRILNAHSGPLPEVRGMNASEWSILLGYEPTVTIHLIDQGIDTGGILSKHPVRVYEEDSIEHLRKRCVAVGVEALCDTVLNPPDVLPDSPEGAGEHRQCFVLAPALRELLGKKIDEGKERRETITSQKRQ